MADSSDPKGGLGNLGNLSNLSNLANMGGSLGNSKEGLLGGVFSAGKAGMKMLQQGKLLYDINMLKRELNTSHEKLQELALTMNRQGKLATVPELATMCSTVDALTAALAQREAEYHQLQAPPLPANLQTGSSAAAPAAGTEHPPTSQQQPAAPTTTPYNAPPASAPADPYRGGTAHGPADPYSAPAAPAAPVVFTAPPPPPLPAATETLFCPTCGRPVRPNARFCGNCRSQLLE